MEINKVLVFIPKNILNCLFRWRGGGAGSSSCSLTETLLNGNEQQLCRLLPKFRLETTFAEKMKKIVYWNRQNSDSAIHKTKTCNYIYFILRFSLKQRKNSAVSVYASIHTWWTQLMPPPLLSRVMWREPCNICMYMQYANSKTIMQL